MIFYVETPTPTPYILIIVILKEVRIETDEGVGESLVFDVRPVRGR